ncbi:hypothetical protein [Asticcacaulis sp. EMRT-3]|uniref:hypothetical protein n=1 Tax=Asticcacaulis sp. EMRT-3 TaxID=3040349 RepID=UPI0024AECFA4|nr:hypothetical protein [Asticcacaulis sp. EMRT-3]MDI7774746.1 hypothetical protein [Asticcacaulis sp. EMRT-3]
MISSISKAIKIVQDAGFSLEPDGEGLWRINGGEWFSSARLTKFAYDLLLSRNQQGHCLPRLRPPV